MPPTDEVYIWLGANTMLAYPTDEAETLLTGRLGDAKKSLENCEEDLEFLREQITVCHAGRATKTVMLTRYQTMEVAVARVYNWDVVQKRKEKSEGETNEKDQDKVKSGGG